MFIQNPREKNIVDVQRYVARHLCLHPLCDVWIWLHFKAVFWTQVPIPWVDIVNVYPYNSEIKFIYFLDRVDLSSGSPYKVQKLYLFSI